MHVAIKTAGKRPAERKYERASESSVACVLKTSELLEFSGVEPLSCDGKNSATLPRPSTEEGNRWAERIGWGRILGGCGSCSRGPSPNHNLNYPIRVLTAGNVMVVYDG